MGGINHQPCSKYIGESTRLSRFVSLAHAHLELGNVALEEILIAELDGGKGAIAPMRHHLQLSQDHILQAIDKLRGLERKMIELDYTDLPALRTLDLGAIGEQLASKGMVDLEAWKGVARIMQGNSFFGNIQLIRAGLEKLLELTQELLAGVTSIADFADAGQLTPIVEENRTGNIKEPFARLFTAWAGFHQMFLASSLVSTEVWYANQGFGSLVTGPVTAPTVTEMASAN